MIPPKAMQNPRCNRETLLCYHWFIKCFDLKLTEHEQKTLSNPYRSDQCPPCKSRLKFPAHKRGRALSHHCVIFLVEETGLTYHMKDKKSLLQQIQERKNFRTKLELRNALPFIHPSTFPSLRTGNATADKFFDICKK